MSPAKFEFWTGSDFQDQGYRDIVATEYSSKLGIDVYMTLPDRKPAVVQCRRHSSTVGRPTLQQSYGTIASVSARRCFVVTTGRFSSEARKVERQHRDVILLDGQQLAESSRGKSTSTNRRWPWSARGRARS
jgi:HJR/Mrr/RecB family endonuclease